MIAGPMCLKSIWVLLVVGLLIFPVSAKPKKMQRIATGAWGGQGVHIEVTEKSATIEFDCAHGTIDGPLMMDSKGQFNWKGTYSRERGGPVRIDETAKAQAATYSGGIKAKTMTLILKLASEEKPLQTFTLSQGASGRLRKCL